MVIWHGCFSQSPFRTLACSWHRIHYAHNRVTKTPSEVRASAAAAARAVKDAEGVVSDDIFVPREGRFGQAERGPALERVEAKWRKRKRGKKCCYFCLGSMIKAYEKGEGAVSTEFWRSWRCNG